ncbi:MAG: class I SAM-dependent methyltransferase [Bauldia sp.]
MSAALQVVTTPEESPPPIRWLIDAVRRNRFMPFPPQDRLFVGDGDYRAIGAEFLGHAVELGGLRPDAHVLDIGCGIGRLAVPMTQYLDPERGTYDGVDPVKAGIDWCDGIVTPAYPNFRFQHLDIRHAIYNPTGTVAGAEVTLPFAAAAFDFVALISVATHLPAAELRRYAVETARVLAPGGTVMLTAFVMTLNSDAPSRTRDPRLDFKRVEGGPEWHVDKVNPLGAVAFDDGLIEEVVDAAGLEVRRKSLGRWRGRPSAHFQDIFIIGHKQAK